MAADAKSIDGPDIDIDVAFGTVSVRI